MKQITVPLIVALMLMGCSNMTATEQRASSGTLGGAAAGAAIGAMAGNAGMGAGIGAGAGLLGGLIYDHYKKNEEAAFQQGYTQGAASARSKPPGQ